jgi:predicted Zn-dependent peptidase
VTAEEVERAVALIQTDLTTALQLASERADRMSMFATLLGDAELVNQQVARYRAVTVSQVSSFAGEYLGTDNQARLMYVPRGDNGAEDIADLAEVAAS